MSQIKDGDLVRVVLKAGTHLAESKNTPSAFRGTQLSDKNRQLDGQAEFIKVDEDDVYQPPYEYNDIPKNKSISEQMAEVLKEALIEVIRETVPVLIDAASPYVKKWWNNTFIPSMQGIWGGLTGGKTRAEQLIANKDNSPAYTTEFDTASSVVPTDLFSDKLESALEKYTLNINSEEAQKELIEIVILTSILAVKIKKLSIACVSKDDEMLDDNLEWQKFIEKLTAQKVTESINLILENNISLVNEKSLTTFSENLGINLILNGRYIPIENDKFRAALALEKVA